MDLTDPPERTRVSPSACVTSWAAASSVTGPTLARHSTPYREPVSTNRLMVFRHHRLGNWSRTTAPPFTGDGQGFG